MAGLGGAFDEAAGSAKKASGKSAFEEAMDALDNELKAEKAKAEERARTERAAQADNKKDASKAGKAASNQVNDESLRREREKGREEPAAVSAAHDTQTDAPQGEAERNTQRMEKESLATEKDKAVDAAKSPKKAAGLADAADTLADTVKKPSRLAKLGKGALRATPALIAADAGLAAMQPTTPAYDKAVADLVGVNPDGLLGRFAGNIANGMDTIEGFVRDTTEGIAYGIDETKRTGNPITGIVNGLGRGLSGEQMTFADQAQAALDAQGVPSRPGQVMPNPKEQARQAALAKISDPNGQVDAKKLLTINQQQYNTDNLNYRGNGIFQVKGKNNEFVGLGSASTRSKEPAYTMPVTKPAQYRSREFEIAQSYDSALRELESRKGTLSDGTYMKQMQDIISSRDTSINNERVKAFELNNPDATGRGGRSVSGENQVAAARLALDERKFVQDQTRLEHEMASKQAAGLREREQVGSENFYKAVLAASGGNEQQAQRVMQRVSMLPTDMVSALHGQASPAQQASYAQSFVDYSHAQDQMLSEGRGWGGTTSGAVTGGLLGAGLAPYANKAGDWMMKGPAPAKAAGMALKTLAGNRVIAPVAGAVGGGLAGYAMTDSPAENTVGFDLPAPTPSGGLSKQMPMDAMTLMNNPVHAAQSLWGSPHEYTTANNQPITLTPAQANAAVNINNLKQTMYTNGSGNYADRPYP